VEVAELLQKEFLATYFGTNPKILSFARHLISLGNKPAAKALNEAVRVLGNQFEADRVVERITEEFGLSGPRTGSTNPRALDKETLHRELRKRNERAAEELVQLLGYRVARKLVEKKLLGVLGYFANGYTVSRNGEEHVFDSEAFLDWAIGLAEQK